MSADSLTDRLRGIVKPVGPPPADPGQVRHIPERSVNPETGSSGAEAEGDERSLIAALGGEWRLEGGLRCFTVERREEPDRWHGRVQVGAVAEALQRASADASLLCDGAPARPPFVFVDLETTGLSGGAGTYAFLIGCGWFDASGAFVTRQHLLARGADERPMLQVVARLLAPAGALVSFNGRSFDAPLLETRFQYHRLSWDAGQVPHLDVLHPARRFWRAEAASGEPSSCSLDTLERQLLGADRPDDVPGFEVPGRYFQFVRSGDARPLAGVLEHNRMDLQSLAALTARLLCLVSDGSGAARDSREALALGRVYERAGMPARATDAYERALALPQPGGSALVKMTIRVDALRGLAQLARRSRRHEAAAARWRELLELPGCPRPVARAAAEALAIHHEHRVRDLDSAHRFALRTLEVGLVAARNTAVRHRLARIERKMAAGTQLGWLQLGD